MVQKKNKTQQQLKIQSLKACWWEWSEEKARLEADRKVTDSNYNGEFKSISECMALNYEADELQEQKHSVLLSRLQLAQVHQNQTIEN